MKLLNKYKLIKLNPFENIFSMWKYDPARDVTYKDLGFEETTDHYVEIHGKPDPEYFAQQVELIDGTAFIGDTVYRLSYKNYDWEVKAVKLTLENTTKKDVIYYSTREAAQKELDKKLENKSKVMQSSELRSIKEDVNLLCSNLKGCSFSAIEANINNINKRLKEL